MLLDRNQANDDIARVAWLCYVGNLSQQEISHRLGVSRFKVLRMLATRALKGWFWN